MTLVKVLLLGYKGSAWEGLVWHRGQRLLRYSNRIAELGLDLICCVCDYTYGIYPYGLPLGLKRLLIAGRPAGGPTPIRGSRAAAGGAPNGASCADCLTTRACQGKETVVGCLRHGVVAILRRTDHLCVIAAAADRRHLAHHGTGTGANLALKMP